VERVAKVVREMRPQEETQGSTIAVRSIRKADADLLDREHWHDASSSQKFSDLWALTVAWMDMHGIPEEQRRLQRTVVALQRRRR